MVEQNPYSTWKHTVVRRVLSLLTAVVSAAPVVGCGAAYETETDALEELDSHQQAIELPPFIATEYYIDQFDSDTIKWGWDGLFATEYEEMCSQYENGVVRSWYLKERNHYDFRYSRHYCRPMLGSGTLGSSYDRVEHFFHDRSGTTGNSSIPLSRLPVGLRIQYKNSSSSLFGKKLGDVALLYNSAANIYQKRTNFSSAGYALGRSGPDTQLLCSPGYVIAGLSVGVDATPAGNHQEEITRLNVHCRKLAKRAIIAPL